METEPRGNELIVRYKRPIIYPMKKCFRTNDFRTLGT